MTGPSRLRGMLSRISTTTTAALLFATTFVVFFAPLRHGGTGDTVPAQLLPISILFEGNFDFNEFVCPADAAGRASDYDALRCTAPLPYYFGVVDGRVVSNYPIVPGLLNVPVHAGAVLLGVNVARHSVTLSMLTAALVTAGSVAFMFLVLAEVARERSTALLGALVYAFGTVVWSVAARGLWQHGPSLLLLNAALYLLVRRGGERAIPWAGLLLGLAVFNRPANALLAAPLAVYVLLHHRREALRFCAMAAVPAVAMLVYSMVVLKSWTSLGQGQDMVAGARPLEGLLGILFSPARGLFVFSPILLLGLVRLPRVISGRARHPIAVYLLAGTAALIGLHAVWHIWWGGHSFGYRLLAEAVPFFILLLAVAWEETLRRSRLFVGLTAVLLAVSVYIHFLGAFVAPCGFDSSPNFIDYHPERLWQIHETELIRCTRALGASHASGFF